jgi:hypothetical protein
MTSPPTPSFEGLQDYRNTAETETMIERDKIPKQDLVPLLLSWRLRRWGDEVNWIVRLANLEGALAQTYRQDHRIIMSLAVRFGKSPYFPQSISVKRFILYFPRSGPDFTSLRFRMTLSAPGADT